MISIYLLTVLLIILLLVSFSLFKGDVVNPAFIFTASFVFSCIWASVYKTRWDFNLHDNTFWVILGGVTEFVLVCYIVHLYYMHKYKCKGYWVRAEAQEILISKGILIAFIVFEVLTIAITALFLRRVTGDSNLASAIYLYRNNQDQLINSGGMPTYLSLARSAVNASGYWFAYIISNNWVAKRHVPPLELAVLIISILNGLVMGGRGNLVFLMLAVFVFYWITSNKNRGSKNDRANFRILLITLAIVVGVIISYQLLGNQLGRSSTANPMDYLATYFGAEVKNLDIVLQRNISNGSSIWGEQTFINLIKFIGPKIGHAEVLNINAATQFLSINGYNLGNVYTTFYAFIYDFGYFGVFWLVLLMAIICQITFERIRVSKFVWKNKIGVVFYGYIFSTILFSYFSNKFYEQVFSGVMIYTLLFWCIFNLVFSKIRFVIGNNK